MLIDYNKLPDYMSVDDLRKYFDQLMDIVESSKNADADLALTGLWELADRQWHTYTLIEKNIKSRIEFFINDILISQIWKGKPLLFLRQILSVIGNLGLTNSYKLVKEILEENMPPILRNEMLKFIQDVDKYKKGKVDDPYIVFKKGV